MPIDAKEMSYSFVIMDGAGNTHITENQNLSVVDNDSPIAYISNIDVMGQGEPMFPNANNSTDNIGIDNYTWSFINVDENIVLHGPNPTFTFHIVGKYTVTLNVTDAEGNWDTDTLNVIILDITPPTADAGPDITINQSDTVEFFFHQHSSDNMGIENWTWTFEYNGTEQALFHSIIMSSLPLFKFDIPGIYTVTMNVTDEAGNHAVDALNVTVLDTTSPEPNAGGVHEIDVNTTFRFNGTGSGDNIGIANYTWTFEYDGKIVTLFGQSPEFMFEIPGEYDIELVVTDTEGNSASDRMSITVIPSDDIGPIDNDDKGKEKDSGVAVWIWLGFAVFVIAVVLLLLFIRKKKDIVDEGSGEDEMGRVEKNDGIGGNG